MNPRPADYKSAALPTELHQLMCFHSSIILTLNKHIVKKNFKKTKIIFKPYLQAYILMERLIKYAYNDLED